MPWIDPKTNWIASDFFNATDYNRIRDNLDYLRELGGTLYPAFPIVDAGTKSTASFAYASDFNALERSIDAIEQHTFKPSSLQATKTWQENRFAPLAEDLNRIEKSTLLLYNVLISQKNLRPKLAFGLSKGMF